ncbi:site-2 protease family protein [Paenibacillus hamazuiensis]|uniref:site-2 protease family protein n=1 Tax=Paenibacillus hamazuiensis TaxID=2936508 RepID=UPI00200C99CE|nr:site-2 protease family protein [Paenibacillus hamazuiensis]
MSPRNNPHNNRKRNPLWVIGTAFAFLLAKAKTLLPLLKFGKAGAAVLSMLASVAAYAMLYPLGFAVGLVLLIFVHELGHVIAAKRKGLPVTAPLFIPFLGAFISMKRYPRDAVTEAYMAIGGPMLGTVGAVAVFAAAEMTGHRLLYALAYAGFLLNLVNLLPVHPLDGGRIVTAVTRWLWLAGLIGGLVVIYYTWNFVLIFIWIMFALNLYNKFVKYRKRGQQRSAAAAFPVSAQPLVEQGYFIPGPEHKRELDFSTYSNLDDARQVVNVYWDGLQFQGRLELPQQGLVRRAQVVKIEHVQREEGLQLIVHCQVDYEVYENDAYYDVPVASRWKFGAAYGLLVGFLVYMMHLIHKAVDL